jgi:hypothetical protein
MAGFRLSGWKPLSTIRHSAFGIFAQWKNVRSPDGPIEIVRHSKMQNAESGNEETETPSHPAETPSAQIEMESHKEVLSPEQGFQPLGWKPRYFPGIGNLLNISKYIIKSNKNITFALCFQG